MLLKICIVFLSIIQNIRVMDIIKRNGTNSAPNLQIAALFEGIVGKILPIMAKEKKNNIPFNKTYKFFSCVALLKY